MKNLKLISFILCLFCTSTLSLNAQDNFKAKVVGIVDGDTITVLTKENIQIPIRLLGIDAPEKNQDFGMEAKRFISELVFNQKVIIQSVKKDKYGRMIAKVLLNGKDVNLLLVESGFAWHYEEFENEQAKTDWILYSEAEIKARKLLSGLWKEPNSVKPSDFRKQGESQIVISIPQLVPSGRTILPVLKTSQPIQSASNNATDSNGTSVRSYSRSDGVPESEKTVQVDGYTRKDGTYVPPHTRRPPSKKP